MLLLLPNRFPAGLEKGTVGLFRGLCRNKQLHCWRGMPECPFYYKGKSLCRGDRCLVPLLALRLLSCSVSSEVKHNPPQPRLPKAQQHLFMLALTACAQARDGSSAPLRLSLQLSVRTGWPPAGQACRRSSQGWSLARAIVLLLFVHHPKDWQLHCYGVIVASSAGNRNKAGNSTGTGKHHRQMDLS